MLSNRLTHVLAPARVAQHEGWGKPTTAGVTASRRSLACASPARRAFSQRLAWFLRFSSDDLGVSSRDIYDLPSASPDVRSDRPEEGIKGRRAFAWVGARSLAADWWRPKAHWQKDPAADAICQFWIAASGTPTVLAEPQRQPRDKNMTNVILTLIVHLNSSELIPSAESHVFVLFGEGVPECRQGVGVNS